MVRVVIGDGEGFVLRALAAAFDLVGVGGAPVVDGWGGGGSEFRCGHRGMIRGVGGKSNAGCSWGVFSRLVHRERIGFLAGGDWLRGAAAEICFRGCFWLELMSGTTESEKQKRAEEATRETIFARPAACRLPKA